MAFVIRNPYAGPGEFRKAQLHCHTTESDGRIQPRELLEMYRDAGYSFVCITDHNRVTRCDELNGLKFLAIPGSEDTVSRVLPPLGPHMARLLVDAPLRSGTPQERIDRTLYEGGIAGLCHPSWNGNLWSGTWSRQAIMSLRGFQLLEIWNPHSNSSEDIRRWDAALRVRGRDGPVWGVAVDDCHRRRQFNRGWIMLKVQSVSPEEFRRALVHGAFYASTGPSAEFAATMGTIDVRLAERGEITFIDASGRRHQTAGIAAQYPVRGDEEYVRIECATSIGRIWSQPFWVGKVM